MENNKLQICEFCQEVFSNLDDLAYHLVYDHANDLSEENLAFKNNQGSNYLQNHVNDQKVQENNKCDSGENIFQARELSRHIRSEHVDINSTQKVKKNLKCDYCGKSFSLKAQLKTHIHTVHEGYKKYECESCLKSFSQKGHLKKHIRSVHEGHKDYKCEPCRKSFSQVGTLKRHIQTIH